MRPGWKQGNADALSWHACSQPENDSSTVAVNQRNQSDFSAQQDNSFPQWTPEDIQLQNADLDLGTMIGWIKCPFPTLPSPGQPYTAKSVGTQETGPSEWNSLLKVRRCKWRRKGFTSAASPS